MSMTTLFDYWPLAVLALQGLFMGADELLFHRHRALARWERVGHPLDTLTVLVPLLLTLSVLPQSPWIGAFIAMAIFSCVFVTKDEWVHARLCGGGENWLHAMLFILHPVLFLALFTLWKNGHYGWLTLQAVVTSCFLAYQVVYWNFVRAASPEPAPEPVNNAFYDDLGDRWLHAEDDPVALLRAEGRAKQQWITERLAEAFPEAFPKPGGKRLRILDVGCGAGFLARQLASLGHEVQGLDYSRGSLLTSRRAEAGGAEVGKVRYVQGDAMRLPFEAGTFDVVCSLDFLEHVEDPAATVEEAARVLKPGGAFFFHTFNRNPLAWLIVIKGLEWFVKNTPAHMHVLRLFIKPRELAGFCRASGMEPYAWTGLRPDFKRRAFWRMLRTGSVPADFAFETTPSLMLSYLGVAKKQESQTSRQEPQRTHRGHKEHKGLTPAKVTKKVRASSWFKVRST